MATAKARTLPLNKRGFNFETIMWIFTRLTALAMYALMIAGLIGALIVSAQTGSNLGDVLRWAFFPNLSASPFSGMPWVAILAKLMVSAFILVVCGHGVHGILEILDDYFTSPFARRASRNAIIAFAVVAILIAGWAIWLA